jgi:hypothetical protein
VSAALWYFTGLATIPAGLLIYWAFTKLTYKNLGSECTLCGRVFGVCNENYAIATRIRARLHRCPKKKGTPDA